MRWTVLIPLLLLAACDPFTTSNGTVDEAIEEYEAGEFEAAHNRLEEAREELPERSELHYDLGTVLLAREEWADAEVAFSRALEQTTDHLRPMILANLGLARLQQALAEEDAAKRKEHLVKALDALERALLLRPEMEPARRNLELTLLNLYPPCRVRDDAFEPNDTPDAAAVFSEAAGQDLLLCPGNVDLYKVTREAGDRWTLNVTQQKAGETQEQEQEQEAERDPAEVIAPPAVELLSSTGAIIADGKTEGDRVTAQVTVPAAGDYYVRILEHDDEEHRYVTGEEVLPSCASLEDEFEENDSAPEAAELPREAPAGAQGQGPGGGGHPVRVCPGDQDWFKVDLQQHESLLVQFQHEPVAGDVALTVYNQAGEPVARGVAPSKPADENKADPEGDQGKNQRSLMATLLDVTRAGSYTIQLTGIGEDAETAGQLSLVIAPPCPVGDDQLEENDTADQATDLTQHSQAAAGMPGGAQPARAPQAEGEEQAPPPLQVQMLLRRCPGDDDWFSLPVHKDAPLQVQIGFEHAKGDLALEAWREDGDEAARRSDESTVGQGGEGLLLTTENEADETTWLVRVTGPENATNFYQLQVQGPQGDGQQQNQNDDQKQDDQKQDDQKQDDQKQDDQKQDDQKQDDQKQDDQKQDDQKQKEQQPEKPKEPIEQMMEQLDRQKRPNLEAERALRNGQNIQAPGGKVW